ncbi:Uncharacterised protein [Zhongshania aliphaticivorans]|uniref:Uncharacterized protein n=1 Tax=Zhongshania aliphaticivorans TaxID=1470434 RepID=A0A5S9NCH7_9GAMM|nr:hypothetical protein [Zhongshania aliphaticivorans]CAA0087594.1 Uncharacterised protein [Zhongshania aliphaticivorans]CAA0115172.1 Uncharacterised protein [Zhongshania aliphaticivorans]CAA0120024.1 Uncharacterised protein [Zhongshania aliphaticivorans]
MNIVKKAIATLALVSMSSFSFSGPLTPVVNILSQVGSQLEGLGGGEGIPGLSVLPLDPFVLLGTLPVLNGELVGLEDGGLTEGGVLGLEGLLTSLNPSNLIGGGLPDLSPVVALLGVGLPTVPGLDFLPIDLGSILGEGDALGLPVIGALPIDVLSILSGGPVPGLNVLPIDILGIIPI